MFDRQSEKLLRAAPAVPGLDANALPDILTGHYAALVARRFRGDTGQGDDDNEWPLARIADTYELITARHKNPKIRRASAFVAGTAQQILARELKLTERADQAPSLSRDNVHPAITAALLFLIAEQYADAHEASIEIVLPPQGSKHVYTILVEHLRDLARGRMKAILRRSRRRSRQYQAPDTSAEAATIALYGKIVEGVELLAAEVNELSLRPTRA